MPLPLRPSQRQKTSTLPLRPSERNRIAEQEQAAPQTAEVESPRPGISSAPVEARPFQQQRQVASAKAVPPPPPLQTAASITPPPTAQEKVPEFDHTPAAISPQAAMGSRALNAMQGEAMGVSAPIGYNAAQTAQELSGTNLSHMAPIQEKYSGNGITPDPVRSPVEVAKDFAQGVKDVSVGIGPTMSDEWDARGAAINARVAETKLGNLKATADGLEQAMNNAIRDRNWVNAQRISEQLRPVREEIERISPNVEAIVQEANDLRGNIVTYPGKQVMSNITTLADVPAMVIRNTLFNTPAALANAPEWIVNLATGGDYERGPFLETLNSITRWLVNAGSHPALVATKELRDKARQELYDAAEKQGGIPGALVTQIADSAFDIGVRIATIKALGAKLPFSGGSQAQTIGGQVAETARRAIQSALLMTAISDPAQGREGDFGDLAWRYTVTQGYLATPIVSRFFPMPYTILADFGLNSAWSLSVGSDGFKAGGQYAEAWERASQKDPNRPIPWFILESAQTLGADAFFASMTRPYRKPVAVEHRVESELPVEDAVRGDDKRDGDIDSGPRPDDPTPDAPRDGGPSGHVKAESEARTEPDAPSNIDLAWRKFKDSESRAKRARERYESTPEFRRLVALTKGRPKESLTAFERAEAERLISAMKNSGIVQELADAYRANESAHKSLSKLETELGGSAERADMARQFASADFHRTLKENKDFRNTFFGSDESTTIFNNVMGPFASEVARRALRVYDSEYEKHRSYQLRIGESEASADRLAAEYASAKYDAIIKREYSNDDRYGMWKARMDADVGRKMAIGQLQSLLSDAIANKQPVSRRDGEKIALLAGNMNMNQQDRMDFMASLYSGDSSRIADHYKRLFGELPEGFGGEVPGSKVVNGETFDATLRTAPTADEKASTRAAQRIVMAESGASEAEINRFFDALDRGDTETARDAYEQMVSRAPKRAAEKAEAEASVKGGDVSDAIAREILGGASEERVNSEPVERLSEPPPPQAKDGDGNTRTTFDDPDRDAGNPNWVHEEVFGRPGEGETPDRAEPASPPAPDRASDAQKTIVELLNKREEFIRNGVHPEAHGIKNIERQLRALLRAEPVSPPVSTAIEKNQAATGTGLTGDSVKIGVGTSERPPAPESKDTLEKQGELARSPESTRKGVLVTKGEEAPESVKGLPYVDSAHGRFYYDPPKMTEEEARKAGEGPVFDGTALGMASDGKGVEASETAVTTTVKGEDGKGVEVASEVVSTPEQVKAAIEAQKASVPGGDTKVVPAKDVLRDRASAKAPVDQVKAEEADDEQDVQVGESVQEGTVEQQAEATQAEAGTSPGGAVPGGDRGTSGAASKVGDVGRLTQQESDVSFLRNKILGAKSDEELASIMERGNSVLNNASPDDAQWLREAADLRFSELENKSASRNALKRKRKQQADLPSIGTVPGTDSTSDPANLDKKPELMTPDEWNEKKMRYQKAQGDMVKRLVDLFNEYAKKPNDRTLQDAVSKAIKNDPYAARIALIAANGLKQDAWPGSDRRNKNARIAASFLQGQLVEFEDPILFLRGDHKSFLERRARLIENASLQPQLNAAAVDSYGINLPDGYVRDGDRYVFKGDAEKPEDALKAKDADEKPASFMDRHFDGYVDYMVKKDMIPPKDDPTHGESVKALRGHSQKMFTDLERAISEKDYYALNEKLYTGNQFLRSVFAKETGVTLPSSNSGTADALRKFVGNEAYGKQKAARDAELKAKADEEAIKDTAKKEKALVDSIVGGGEKELYLEYLATLNPLKRGTTVKALNKLYRKPVIDKDGSTITERELIEQEVAGGRTVTTEEYFKPLTDKRRDNVVAKRRGLSMKKMRGRIDAEETAELEQLNKIIEAGGEQVSERVLVSEDGTRRTVPSVGLDYAAWLIARKADQAPAEKEQNVEDKPKDSTSVDRSKLEEQRQMLLDIIKQRREQGQEPRPEHRRRLAELDALLAGEEPESGAIASELVFGHPEATSIGGGKYSNLIPIRVSDRASVERFMDRAQKELDALQDKIGTQEAVNKGYMSGNKKAAKKYLSSQQYVEDATIRDMLRNETMPELNRLLKMLPEAKEPVAAKEPWQMTLLDYAKSKAPKSQADQLVSDDQVQSYRPQYIKDMLGWRDAGKEIPADVVQEYPELQKSSSAKATQQQKDAFAAKVKGALNIGIYANVSNSAALEKIVFDDVESAGAEILNEDLDANLPAYKWFADEGGAKEVADAVVAEVRAKKPQKKVISTPAKATKKAVEPKAKKRTATNLYGVSDPAQRISTDDAIKIASPLSSKDGDRLALNSVYLDKDAQVVVATDGKAMAIVPANVDGESRIIGVKYMKGQVLDLQYPNWRKVVPDMDAAQIVKSVDVAATLSALKAALPSKKSKNEPTINITIPIPDGSTGMTNLILGGRRLQTALVAMKTAKIKDARIHIADRMSPVTLTGDGIRIIIMPEIGTKYGEQEIEMAFEDAAKEIQPTPANHQPESISTEAQGLMDSGLLRKTIQAGNEVWQYRQNGMARWMTANSQQDAVEEAKKYVVKKGDAQPQTPAKSIMQYTPEMHGKIRGIGKPPRGTGFRYLEYVDGPAGEFIAKAWAKNPVIGRKYIEFESRPATVKKDFSYKNTPTAPLQQITEAQIDDKYYAEYWPNGWQSVEESTSDGNQFWYENKKFTKEFGKKSPKFNTKQEAAQWLFDNVKYGVASDLPPKQAPSTPKAPAKPQMTDEQQNTHQPSKITDSVSNDDMARLEELKAKMRKKHERPKFQVADVLRKPSDRQVLTESKYEPDTEEIQIGAEMAEIYAKTFAENGKASFDGYARFMRNELPDIWGDFESQHVLSFWTFASGKVPGVEFDDITRKQAQSIISEIDGGSRREDDSEQKEPIYRLVDSIFERLMAGDSLDNPTLTRMANEAFGGSRGEGKYDPRDAYDAMEAAINRYIEEYGMVDFDDPSGTIQRLLAVQDRIARQADRTDEQIKFQQFSTPPAEAFVAVYSAGISRGMTVLEPSAGTGNIATMARIAGATVVTNELSERRRGLLEYLGFKAYGVDAEMLHSVLPESVRPDAVVMNPPFSATAGRTNKNKTEYGAKHVSEALLRVNDGGRVVAIVGRGMAHDRPTFSDWWAQMEEKYSVRANVGIDGKHYGKYGTGFDNQILVLDKTGATQGLTRAERVGNIIIDEGLSPEDALLRLGGLGEEDVYERIKSRSRGTGENDPDDSLRPESDRDGKSDPDADKRGDRGESPEGTDEQGDGMLGTDAKRKSRKSRGGGGGGSRSGGRRPASRDSGADVSYGGRPGWDGTDEPTIRRSSVSPVGDNGELKDDSPTPYAPYRVKKAIFDVAQPHPAVVVESKTMAAVEPPDISYVPLIPRTIAQEGRLSDIQIEAVAYAGQRHEQTLPDGSRAGIWIGDGTGMGKGRTTSGIILDNYNNGRKRAVWMSIGHDLGIQARGDLSSIGYHGPLIMQNATSGDIPDVDGVLFTTYKMAAHKWKSGRERFNQLVAWLGEDFDGVIAFDEAHQMKNAYASGIGGGQASAQQGTDQGNMALELQAKFPNARIVYVSATGATVPRNMGYLSRLGLWGKGAPFQDFIGFLSAMNQGGIGAMEMLARDLKAVGAYMSRSISYAEVENDVLEHRLTKEQSAQYDAASDLWASLIKEFEIAAETAGWSNQQLRSNLAQFYGAQQRFFLQLMVSYQLPSLFKAADKDIEEGRQVIISLFNTNEQATKRMVGEAVSQGIELEDMDFTPRGMIEDLLNRFYPVAQFQEVADPNDPSKTIRGPVLDQAGNPVLNRENLEKREALIDNLSKISLPENPFDAVVNHFGPKRTAEISGRKKRLEGNRYVTRKVEGVKSKDLNKREKQAFQEGKKKVAVISGAASTGIDLHADASIPNKNRRVFYALQLSWSADVQMQAFGRAHRANQTSAPIIRLVKTDIPGQKRLVNTVQSRLASLGSISKGGRETLSTGLFTIEDITDEYGETALRETWGKLDYTLLDRMNVLDKDGNVKQGSLDDVEGFLNRIMVLPVETQKTVFDLFYNNFKRIIERAREQGLLDLGVQEIKAMNMRLVGAPEVVYRHPESGAETRLVMLEGEKETPRLSYNDAAMSEKSRFGFFQNNRSKKVYAVGETWDTNKVRLTNVHYDSHTVEEWDLKDSDRYTKLSNNEAKTLWDEQYSAIPEVTTYRYPILTGAVFPIYNIVFNQTNYERGQVYSTRTEKGERYIGFYIDEKNLPSLKQRLGIGAPLSDMTGKEIYGLVHGGAIVELNNGWRVKGTRVHGEKRIELDWRGYYPNDSELTDYGLFMERIDYKNRWFVPLDERIGPDVVGRLIKAHKAVRDLTNDQPRMMAADTSVRQYPTLLIVTRDGVVKARELNPRDVIKSGVKSSSWGHETFWPDEVRGGAARARIEGNELTWTTEPTDEDRFAVENWLFRNGFEGVRDAGSLGIPRFYDESQLTNQEQESIDERQAQSDMAASDVSAWTPSTRGGTVLSPGESRTAEQHRVRAERYLERVRANAGRVPKGMEPLLAQSARIVRGRETSREGKRVAAIADSLGYAVGYVDGIEVSLHDGQNKVILVNNANPQQAWHEIAHALQATGRADVIAIVRQDSEAFGEIMRAVMSDPGRAAFWRGMAMSRLVKDGEELTDDNIERYVMDAVAENVGADVLGGTDRLGLPVESYVDADALARAKDAMYGKLRFMAADVDALGFYSPLARAIESMPESAFEAVSERRIQQPERPAKIVSDKKGNVLKNIPASRPPDKVYPAMTSAEHVLSELKKLEQSGDIRWEEVDDIHFADWLLEANGYVTKDEALAFVRAGGPKLDVKVLGDVDVGDVEAWWNDEGGANEETPWEELSESEQQGAMRRYRDEVAEYREDSTKYSQYQLEGEGENYREVLLTLPARPKKVLVEGGNKTGHKVGIFEATQLDDGRWAYIAPDGSRMGGAKETYEELTGQVWGFQNDVLEDVNYKSSHWDEPNVVLHLRVSDRVDADGRKTLLVEEDQSDWHQEGRKTGYKETAKQRARRARNALVDQRLYTQEFVDAMDDGYVVAAASKEASGFVEDLGKIPDAPFKKSWPLLGMKMVLRMAAAEGYDQIAWTTGDQQAERYDLSKHISELAYWKDEDGTYGVSLLNLDGRPIDSWNPRDGMDEKELEAQIGKDIAKRIVDDTGEANPENSGFAEDGRLEDGVKVIQGEGLKVGGEGMKGFYDKILPSELNKYVRKMDKDAKVGKALLPTTLDGWAVTFRGEPVDDDRYATKDEAKTVLRQSGNGGVDGYWVAQMPDGIIEVHALPITPAIRESVMQGQPLFMAADVDLESMAAMERYSRRRIREIERELNAAQPDLFGEYEEMPEAKRKELESERADLYRFLEMAEAEGVIGNGREDDARGASTDFASLFGERGEDSTVSSKARKHEAIQGRLGRHNAATTRDIEKTRKGVIYDNERERTGERASRGAGATAGGLPGQRDTHNPVAAEGQRKIEALRRRMAYDNQAAARDFAEARYDEKVEGTSEWEDVKAIVESNGFTAVPFIGTGLNFDALGVSWNNVVYINTDPLIRRGQNVTLLMSAMHELAHALELEADAIKYIDVKSASGAKYRKAVAKALNVDASTIDDETLAREIFADLVSGLKYRFGANLLSTLKTGGKEAVARAVESIMSPVLFDMANRGLERGPPMSDVDAEYIAAVDRGDMETAKRMVSEAAKAAGYTIGPVWRGGADTNVLNLTFAKEDEGFFFSSSKEIAAGYQEMDGINLKKASERLDRASDAEIAAIIDILDLFDEGREENLFSIKRYLESADGDPEMSQTLNEVMGQLGENGRDYVLSTGSVKQYYLKIENPLVQTRLTTRGRISTERGADNPDGVIRHGFMDARGAGAFGDGVVSTIYSVKKPSQAKLADPVTYYEDGDEDVMSGMAKAGDPIPPSRRFRINSDYIRFMAADTGGRNADEYLDSIIGKSIKFLRSIGDNAAADRLEAQRELAKEIGNKAYTKGFTVGKKEGTKEGASTQKAKDVLAGKKANMDAHSKVTGSEYDKKTQTPLAIQKSVARLSAKDARSKLVAAMRNHQMDVAEKVKIAKAYINDHLRAHSEEKGKLLSRLATLAQVKDTQPGKKFRDEYATMAEKRLGEVMERVNEIEAEALHRDAKKRLTRAYRAIRKYGINEFSIERRGQIENVLGDVAIRELKSDKEVRAAINAMLQDPMIMADSETFNEIKDFSDAMSRLMDDIGTDEMNYIASLLEEALAVQKADTKEAHKRFSEKYVRLANAIIEQAERRGVDFDSKSNPSVSVFGRINPRFLKTEELANSMDRTLLEDVDANGFAPGPISEWSVYPWIDGDRRSHEVTFAVRDYKESELGADFSEDSFKPKYGNTYEDREKSKNTTPFTFASGKTVPLYKGEMIAIAMQYLNEDNLRHITSEKGGLVLPELRHNASRIRVTEDDVAAIYNMVKDDDEMNRIFGVAQHVFDNILKGFINDTSMELDARELAAVMNYVPIFVSRLHNKGISDDFDENSSLTDQINFSAYSVASQGALKHRKSGASGPIMLYDVFSLMHRATRVAALYYGYAKAQKADRIVSKYVRTPDNGGGSVEGAIVKEFGQPYWNALRSMAHYYTDASKSHDGQTVDRIVNALVRGTLSFNAVVAFIQRVSLAGAGIYIPQKYLGLPMPLRKPARYDKMRKYSPFLYARSLGRINIALGEALDRHVRFAEWGMKWIQSNDTWAIGHIWQATENWFKDRFPKMDEDERLTRVARYVEMIVRRTQPSFDPSTRSKHQRSTHYLAKIIGRYSSQTTAIHSMLYRSVVGTAQEKEKLKDWHAKEKTESGFGGRGGGSGGGDGGRGGGGGGGSGGDNGHGSGDGPKDHDRFKRANKTYKQKMRKLNSDRRKVIALWQLMTVGVAMLRTIGQVATRRKDEDENLAYLFSKNYISTMMASFSIPGMMASSILSGYMPEEPIFSGLSSIPRNWNMMRAAFKRGDYIEAVRYITRPFGGWTLGLHNLYEMPYALYEWIMDNDKMEYLVGEDSFGESLEKDAKPIQRSVDFD